ncbi:uncharacterized protein LOC126581361 [Anopheles aquasalis]|uniref:uncharacterized protein LOC126581361 n=1 Tax=Anopheles aquasalis TaxID=42839 RepID=UPI00215B079B|nr:uncharacterized protein LOC126581361 [Anopheles aquasalis]
MHFAKKVIAFVIVVCFIINVSALTCMECVNMGDEKGCDDAGELNECNAEIADRYTAIFSRMNTDIPHLQPNKSKFKCFKLIVVGEEPYFLKGCTFRDLPICEKTNSNVDCGTCEKDECNGLYYRAEDEDDDSGAMTTIGSTTPPLVLYLLAVLARIEPRF